MIRDKFFSFHEATKSLLVLYKLHLSSSSLIVEIYICILGMSYFKDS